MKTITHLIGVLILTFAAGLLCDRHAQTPAVDMPHAQTPAVDMQVDGEHLRVTAPDAAQAVRLRVTNAAGEKVYDSGSLYAPSVEWNLHDQHNRRVADGVYLVTLSVRDQSGQVRLYTEQVGVPSQTPLEIDPASAKQTATASDSSSVGESTNATGTGTTGQVAKWTGTETLGDSIISENAGKIGVGTASPTARLHIAGIDALPSAGAGVAATPLLQMANGRGGSTTGVGFTAGNGGFISLLSGAGGSAPAGSRNGNGGLIFIQPGAPGNGAGTTGSYGRVVIAQLGGNVGVGTSAPASKLTVNGDIRVVGAGNGFRFADNTVQMSAATGTITGVTAGAGLSGGGTSGSVMLIVGDGGIGTAQLANSSVTSEKIVAPLVLSNSDVSAANNAGVSSLNNSEASDVITGMNIGGGSGIRGTSNTGNGVTGASASGNGVYGSVSSNPSGVVDGSAFNGVKGEGLGSDSIGVLGVANNGTFATGVWGMSNSGYAGYFSGHVAITGDLSVAGNISKGGGSFKIDHPLDPANKYLSHSFIESPDMMNIYNGNVTTDAKGVATITMPDYFQSLNRDFRYQLTVIGQFAQAIVANEIKDNRFQVKTNKPNVKVSWQVTGIRQDAYANANRIPVEEDKSEAARGSYLHPEAFGQPAEKSIRSTQRPAQTQQRQEETANTQRMSPQP